jgi:hypothetical protein
MGLGGTSAFESPKLIGVIRVEGMAAKLLKKMQNRF